MAPNGKPIGKKPFPKIWWTFPSVGNTIRLLQTMETALPSPLVQQCNLYQFAVASCSNHGITIAKVIISNLLLWEGSNLIRLLHSEQTYCQSIGNSLKVCVEVKVSGRETVRSRCMYELRPNVGHSAAWLQRPGLILVCDLLLLRFVCGGWRSSACCRTASTKVVMALSKIGPVFHFEFQNSVLPNMNTEPKWVESPI